LLAVSLYSVLWGKSKEQSADNGGIALQVQAEKECDELKETEVTDSEPSVFV
jgi:hypothetical protein